MTNKTTAALKLAEEALEELHYSSGTVKAVTLYKSAIAAIREAKAELEKQEPASNKYNHKRIGWELERTAMGDSYYGNALYSALDLHFLNKREKDCLLRYMYGSETPNDRFVLQDIANKVYFEPEAEPVKQEPVAIVVEVDRHGDATVVSGAWQLDGGTHTFYAAPVDAKAIRAEREWVELTDYEIVRLYAESPMCDSEMIDFARAVIAAFKEKNK